MKKCIVLLVAIMLSVSVFSQAHVTDSILPAAYVESQFGLGLGIGLHYGVFGAKLFFQHTFSEAGVGLGFVPLAWQPVFSGSYSFYFTPKRISFRPKISATICSSTSFIYLYDQNDLSTLAEKYYPGYGIYAGIEYKKPGQKWGLDANVGYLAPFVGADKVIEDYDNFVDELAMRGYSIEKKFGSPSGIRISVGFTYYF
ncbi:MAG: hypothetical protein JXJ22_00795 [Bacteroidales bacterium]|nr:hypothetical protein [Bacteroidales bacterium]